MDEKEQKKGPAIEKRKAYRIPEPGQNPIDALVIFYKVKKGVDYDDRIWDRRFYARVKSAAKDLMGICGEFDTSKRCIDELGRNFDERDLSWSLETVLKHAHDWKKKIGGRNERASRQRFLDDLAKQRANYQGQIEGKESSDGTELAPLGDYGGLED